MIKNNSHYDTIKTEIQSLKDIHHNLRDKSDEKVFTILCIKSNYYKNPSLNFTETDIENVLVDSVNDGGVDALLADPNSETNNLVICQSKYYETITFDIVRDAVAKMISFYKSMLRGEYESVNTKVQRRFLSLNAEIGDESKVSFVFYTSARKNGIREDRIQKLLQEHNLDSVEYEIKLFFVEDIIEEIKESQSQRPTVENGKIEIDKVHNVLFYNDDAVIVNVSAFSIKELYAKHNINLLSRNLRYFIKKREIDSSIKETISKCPDKFWYKNNGITIICDEFFVDGKEVKLKNFSIVNGGQTTTLLHKSKDINKGYDLYLPCKVIRTQGNCEDEKNQFSLEIAQATNSQKAIKQIDLKANSPEQVRFCRSMRNVGIFYQTKRGEVVPKDFKEDYKNTDLVEVGKLCLAGIFQLPGSSRSKPSTLYCEKYYNPVFNGDQTNVCLFVKELLYIDTYYRKFFIQRFDKQYEESPVATEIIPFAHNSRTICIAFVSFASRYYQQNIKESDVRVIFEHINKEKAYDDYYYDIFKEIGKVAPLFPKKLFDDKNKYDEVLYKLFEVIILSGRRYYSSKKESDNTLSESNFLKTDKNYYYILKFDWDNIYGKIKEIFSNI